MAISGETIDYGPLRLHERLQPANRLQFHRPGRSLLLRQSTSNRPVESGAVRGNASAPVRFQRRSSDRTRHAGAGCVSGLYGRIWLDGMRRKIGLVDESAGDAISFRPCSTGWKGHVPTSPTRSFPWSNLDSAAGSDDDAEFQQWKRAWKDRRRNTPAGESIALMSAANPVVIPRNHRVEEALDAAERDDDLEPLRKLLEVISRPLEQRPESAPYGSRGRRLGISDLLRHLNQAILIRSRQDERSSNSLIAPRLSASDRTFSTFASTTPTTAPNSVPLSARRTDQTVAQRQRRVVPQGGATEHANRSRLQRLHVGLGEERPVGCVPRVFRTFLRPASPSCLQSSRISADQISPLSL